MLLRTLKLASLLLPMKTKRRLFTGTKWWLSLGVSVDSKVVFLCSLLHEGNALPLLPPTELMSCLMLSLCVCQSSMLLKSCTQCSFPSWIVLLYTYAYIHTCTYAHIHTYAHMYGESSAHGAFMCVIPSAEDTVFSACHGTPFSRTSGQSSKFLCCAIDSCGNPSPLRSSHTPDALQCVAQSLVSFPLCPGRALYLWTIALYFVCFFSDLHWGKICCRLLTCWPAHSLWTHLKIKDSWA